MGLIDWNIQGTGTGNGTKIPVRYLYPKSERTTNLDNLSEAITRQFGVATADENINSMVWIVK